MQRSNKPRPWPALILAALTLGVLATACYVEVPRARVAVGAEYEYEVDAPPPAVQEETVVETPGAGFIWIPGFWEWDIGVHHYGWHAGRWERPPHEGAVWVTPRYEERQGRRVYTRGHWREREGEHRRDGEREHRD
jgi:WXXGXW repeat (2 copies)